MKHEGGRKQMEGEEYRRKAGKQKEMNKREI